MGTRPAKRPAWRTFGLAFALLQLVAPSSSLAQTAIADPVKYEIVDLGTLGGSYGAANAISDKNVIVGSCGYHGPGGHAFVWADGHMRDLGTLGGEDSAACATNAVGVIAGWAHDRDRVQHLVIWKDPLHQPGEIQDLGRLDFGDPAAINDAGVIVGSATIDTGATFPDGRGVTLPILTKGAFRFDGRKGLTWLEGAGGLVEARAVSKGGVAAGIGGGHVWIWRDGPAIDLGECGSIASDSAMLVDDDGGVLGKIQVDGFGWRRYREPGGAATVLVIPSGPGGLVTGVNSHGVAVGCHDAKNGELHAFRWELDPAGRLIATDLGTLGGRTSTASAINDAGWIVGESETAKLGYAHPVLWRPVASLR